MAVSLDNYSLVEGRYGIKGLFYYGSSFALSALGLGARIQTQIKRVYNFKKWGHNAEAMGKLIRMVADQLGCTEVWAMPSSTVGRVNSLQSIFGVSIERIQNSALRKYNHNIRVDTTGLKFPDKASGTVLLVDDICTTGKSLLAVAAQLSERGIQCKMFAIGLNKKLVLATSPSPETVEDAFRRWREAQKVVVVDEPEEPVDGFGNFDVSALLNSVSGTMEFEEEEEEDFEDRILAYAEDESVLPEQRLKNIIELIKGG